MITGKSWNAGVIYDKQNFYYNRVNLVKKAKIACLKGKLVAMTKSNILNLKTMFTIFVLDGKYLFGANLVQKLELSVEH